MEVWWRKRKARNASAIATTAIAAAKAQQVTVPGQQLAAALVARLAKEVMILASEIGDIETMIEDRFRRHRHAEIILSMPGFVVTLGAEFLATTGGDMDAFDSVDRLAGVSGLAPVPRGSGRIHGNLKRPRRYDRRLLRACYLSAQSAIRTDPASASTMTANEPNARPTPSRNRAGTTTPQRPVGHAPRPRHLPAGNYNRGGLTTSLRISIGDSPRSVEHGCVGAVAVVAAHCHVPVPEFRH